MNQKSHRAISAYYRPCAAMGIATMALLASPSLAASGTVSGVVLPRNLSYWEMFIHASLIVQIVMVMLMLASVATWTIWLAKVSELRAAKRRLAADIQTLSDAANIDMVGAMSHTAPAHMLRVALAETARAGRVRTVAAVEGLKDRVAAQVISVEKDAVEHVVRGTAVLATVGAIAPFIGLFGTVWGIMTSFIGISESQTTSLAVVAPGIAEALLATAIGLFAAIPAVIMYNHIVRSIAGFRNQLSNASTQVACLLSHSLDAQIDQSRETILHAAE